MVRWLFNKVPKCSFDDFGLPCDSALISADDDLVEPRDAMAAVASLRLRRFYLLGHLPATRQPQS
jgi:hypothetical protein